MELEKAWECSTDTQHSLSRLSDLWISERLCSFPRRKKKKMKQRKSYTPEQ